MFNTTTILLDCPLIAKGNSEIEKLFKKLYFQGTMLQNRALAELRLFPENNFV